MRGGRARGAWLLALACCAGAAAPARAAPPPGEAAELEVGDDRAGSAEPRVEVARAVEDEQIAGRLTRILEASEWFVAPAVRVEEGIVFLEGRTSDERYRQWAGDLARRTEDVVAVVNRIELSPSSLADAGPALEGVRQLWTGFVRASPGYLLGLLVLALAYALGRGSTWVWRGSDRRRGQSDLVRDIAARAAGLLVFTLGAYLALRIAGLTRLAATLLGGTGIIGLVLGIAFRDIAENTLASILLTRQQPFRKGDLVEIGGVEGIVQRLTVRATLLLSLDGSHVQIPNSTVYKSAIRNYTSNPRRRIDFSVGIGYADAIARAQDVALGVIQQHPAVLAEPEPWVLAESLGSAAVQLRVYVWVDSDQHSWLKVRSSLIRLVKRAFQEHGVSMPDEAREVVFPEGVPVRVLRREPEAAGQARAPAAPSERSAEGGSVATHAEARLETDAGRMNDLAQGARSPEAGEDLLRPA